MTRTVTIAAAVIIILLLKRKRQKKNRTMWSRLWLLRRKEKGCYGNLMKELRSEDPEFYKNFVRLLPADFDCLVSKVEKLIKKKDTHMREAISTGERLAVTLRYLATGDSYKSLSFLFRIAYSTISIIIAETCNAIYSVLNEEYLKFMYDFHVSLIGLNVISGHLEGIVADTIISGDFSVAVKNAHVQLNDLQITRFGHVSIQLNNNSITRLLNAAISRPIEKLFNERLRTSVSAGVKNHVEGLIRDINENDELALQQFLKSQFSGLTGLS